MLRACTTLALKLPLLLLVLLPGACHLTNQAEEGTIGIAGDSSWTAHDRLVIVLEDGRGADTLFDGKLPGMDTLARLPAGGYAGSQALFIIQGFQDGELAYEEHRSYDGSRQKVIVIDIPFDRRRVTASPDMDLRPDQVRLYLGGQGVALVVLPPTLPESGTLAWKTGNPLVATVSQDGVILPVGVGATYVQAASGEFLRDASAVRVVRDVPVVDAGTPDTTVPAGTAVTFHVSVYQEYGDVAAFAWDLNGDGVFEDSSAGSAGQTRFATPPRTFGTGEVKVRFRVRDGEGNHGEAGKTVTVSASAPKIDSLGARPVVVSIMDTVAFAALATGGGAELRSFAWDFDGDGTYEVTGTLQGERAQVTGTHSYPQPAIYRARLRIVDANAVAISAEVFVTVKLDRPVADAGSDRTAAPGAQVRLQGSGQDTLGRIVSREWKCGPAEFTAAGDSGVYVFTAPLEAGTTSCVFRVTDDDGLTDEDTLKVVVDEADAPSVQSFTPADTTISIRDSVTFTASLAAGTVDLKAYTLDVDGDGKADFQGTLSGRAGEIRIGRRFPTAGRFDVLLTVEDQSGKTATGPSRVLVLLDPPKAFAGNDTTVVAGTRVNLRGIGWDSLGSVVLREWKIGSGLFTRVSSGDTSFNVPQTPGTLVCVFRVTDDDGQTAEDIVQVTISSSGVADLSALTTSIGSLAPIFSPLTAAYAVTVPSATASLTVSPTAAHPGATIRVNGTAVASGAASSPIVLTTNTTVVTIQVTAQDTAVKKSYSVSVTRSSSANADLSALTTSIGSLAPTFSPATAAYAVTVPSATASLTVSPTAAHPGATIRVNGTAVASGTASGPVTLATTPTVITIQVTAQDTAIRKSYTVTVTRAAETNADLSALTPSVGSFAPTFAPQTSAYALLVPNATASLTVTPTASHPGATIRVNGTAVASGAASGPITLPTATTVITIQVTAQDTAVKKSYSVTVTRSPSANANLSALAPSVGSLAPAFTPATTAYAVSVPNATTSLTVTPTVADPAATIRVNGTAVASGTASTPVTLVIGTTAITIQVTAQDTAVKKSYTVTVTRAASPNADLATLTSSIGALTPTFSPATTSYSQSVMAASVRLTPTAAAAGATIQVNGTAVASGSASAAIDLAVGPNPITVRVTAPDGVTLKNYTVNVTRISTDPSLSALSFPAGGSINPTFSPTGLTYTVTATAAMSSFTVRPTAAAAGAIITVDGIAVASGGTSGNLVFPIGNSSHAIVVTAPDGATTRTYNLTVVRPVPSSLRFGYAWVDSYTSSHSLTSFVHNPAGAVDFVRDGTGRYTLHFRGLAALGGAPGIVHATAYVAATSPGAYCKVLSWSGTVDLSASVSCFTMGGVPADTRLNVLALFPRNGTAGENAIALADQASRAANSPYSPNPARAHSSTGPITITRRQAGNYFLQLTGLGGLSGGTPMVTAVGTGNVYCNVDDFNGNGPDLDVYVQCRAGNGTAADAQFNISVMQLYSGTAEGVAVARVEGSQLTAEYAFNNGGGAVSVAATGPGQWQVTFAGLAARGGSRGANVQVTTRFTGTVLCQSGGWSTVGNNLVATVNCFDETGALANWMSSFLVWVLK